MSKIRVWLVGKKTYLASGGFAIVAGVLIFMGKMTASTAVDMAIFAIPLFASTLRSAVQSGQAVKVLGDVAEAGVAYRAHSAAGVVGAVEHLATDLLTPPVVLQTPSQVTGPSGPLSVTVTGAAHEVLATVSALQTTKQVGG